MRRLLAPLIIAPLGLVLPAVAAEMGGPRGGAGRIEAMAQPVLASGVIASLPAGGGLPQVHLRPYDPLRPPPDAVAEVTGTGFFASARGLVVTAAHVVQDCRAIRLVSRHLAATEARVVATDAEHDIAVLQAAGPAPAHLAIGPARAAGRVAVFGFPASARPLALAVTAPRSVGAPHVTWAAIVNDSFVHRAALETDPARLVWMQAPEIAQGYSGGPILDAGSGRVVGIVRALIDPVRAIAAYGIATPDLSIGPGAGPLRAMLGGEAAGVLVDDGDVLARATKATVQILCWQ